MKVSEILLAADSSSYTVHDDISKLFGKLSADEKERVKQDLQSEIKRLDALVTLIDTDC